MHRPWSFRVLLRFGHRRQVPQHSDRPGLLLLIQILLTIMSGGLVWFGTPCRTWVWIARGHTRRSAGNIDGSTLRRDVRQANRIADIVAVLLGLMVLRGVFYLIEQPCSSLVWMHRKLRKHLRSQPMVRNTVLTTTPRVTRLPRPSPFQIHSAGWSCLSFEAHLQSQAQISSWRQHCLASHHF